MKLIKGCFTVIGGLCVLFIVLGVIVGLNTDEQTPPQSSSAQQQSTQAAAPTSAPVITASVAQMLSDYEKNELAADQKYKGRRVKMTGRVASIEEMMGQSFVTLGTGKAFEAIHVQAFFDKEQKPTLARLNKGQKLTITCLIDGQSINVTARECQF